MRNARRRGAVLAVALATLLAVMLLTGLLFQRSLAGQRQLRRDAMQLQAEWLAEAAIARGYARRQADENYSGETWRVELGSEGPTEPGEAETPPAEANPPQLPAGDAGSKSVRTGVVTIRVEPVDQPPGQLQVTVIAQYPDDALRRARAERTYVLPLAPAAEPAP